MKKLKHSPLGETVLELKWTTQEEIPENINMGPNAIQSFRTDSYHKIFFGRMFDYLTTNGYPDYTELPQSGVPEDYATHLVQHRFMQLEKSWPMVQIGPGIVTLNDAKNYDWSEFYKRSTNLVEALYHYHPKKEEIKFTQIVLRYINIIPFNFDQDNVLEFLKDNFKISIKLDDTLFSSTGLSPSPNVVNLLTAFDSVDPAGEFIVNFNRGTHEGEEVLIWELIFRSNENFIPNNPQELSVWIEGAHNVVDRWFRKSIEGELERRFGGYE